MAKYLLMRDIEGVGKSGEIVELDDISNIPFNSKLKLVEDDGKIKVKKKVKKQKKEEVD